VALDHAKSSSRICYNLLYDLLAKLHTSLRRVLEGKNYPKSEQQPIVLKEAAAVLNSIAAVSHLLNTTKDLKLAFAQKERVTALEEQAQLVRRYGCLPTKVDLDLLYDPEERAEHIWIYKNKILD
jgi:hypothetical protein